MDQDQTQDLQERLRAAAAASTPLCLRGAGSKGFLGRAATGEPLVVAGHRGIVNYHPKELVISARAGTSLDAIEAALAEHGQGLPFEPPRLGPGATLGGTIACGLSGPARPYAGSARDFVLGTRVLTGRAEVLRFGGEVMKNVAGYDISRLMTGAMGTLGALLEVSLKVLPLAAATRTQALEMDQAEAIATMNAWAGRPLPVTATCWAQGRLLVRLSGAETSVAQAAREVGGEPLAEGRHVLARSDPRAAPPPVSRRGAPVAPVPAPGHPTAWPTRAGPGDDHHRVGRCPALGPRQPGPDQGPRCGGKPWWSRHPVPRRHPQRGRLPPLAARPDAHPP